MDSFDTPESPLDVLDPNRLPDDNCSPALVWLGGIMAPLILAFFGLRCLVTQSITVQFGRLNNPYPVTFTGWAAFTAGGFLLFLGALLHAHFFWGTRDAPQTLRNVETGKAVLLMGLILCLLGFSAALFGKMFDLF